MKSVKTYTPHIEKECLELVRSLYGVTLDPTVRFRGFTLNILLTVLYGKRYASLEDPTIVKLDNLIVECIDIVGKPIVYNLYKQDQILSHLLQTLATFSLFRLSHHDQHYPNPPLPSTEI